MRKFAVPRLVILGSIGFISLRVIGGAIAFPFPQPAANAPTSIAASNTSGLIWPTQGFISQGFHTYHEGIDISGSIGVPVVAAATGEVIKAGWDDWGLGNAIEIKHPDGSQTVYGHNHRLFVSKGDVVRQGEVIAEMGSSGNSTGPHLHFEVYPNGRDPINPLASLPSLVAGKIPSQQSIAVAPGRPASVAPELTTPVPFTATAVRATGICSNETLVTGETAKFRVNICRENGQLFYVGQSKQNPNDSMRIPARNIGGGRYRADNGSYSYYVTQNRLEVLRYGRRIRVENLSNRGS
ncbi:MAG: M23 family metallopeptidase [Kastovskya adunca ATA6-11-RM4]|jgi:lysostaphin|nr:M23 family metallopeptidase [Kastovskya adunca ATA6-11-RM4]